MTMYIQEVKGQLHWVIITCSKNTFLSRSRHHNSGTEGEMSDTELITLIFGVSALIVEIFCAVGLNECVKPPRVRICSSIHIWRHKLTGFADIELQVIVVAPCEEAHHQSSVLFCKNSIQMETTGLLMSLLTYYSGRACCLSFCCCVETFKTTRFLSCFSSDTKLKHPPWTQGFKTPNCLSSRRRREQKRKE